MGTIEEEPDCDQDGHYWKEQYDTSVGRRTILESLSKDVLKEYDVLVKKNGHLQQEIDGLQKKLESRDTDLQDVKRLIEPAWSEYDLLKNKYNIEKGCRFEAQSFARNIVNENKNLKRQSLDLLALCRNKEPVDFTALNLDLDKEPDVDEDQDKYYATLNNQIRELKNEAAALKTSLAKYNEDLHIEKENHKWAKRQYQALKQQLDQSDMSLRQHKQAIQELSKVSEEAYQEYENLSGKFELEKRRRSFVERKAGEYHTENKKMRRQSEMFMTNVLPNEQLHKALMEVESLTEELVKQKGDYDMQIEELQSEVEIGSKGTVEELQSEMTNLTEENVQLGTKLEEYDKKYNTLETYNIQLQKKYEEAMRPPPPPPPPPPQIQKSKGFLSRIRPAKKVDKAAKLKVAGANVNVDFSKALEEMMNNIKNKKTNLKPTVTPVKKGFDAEGHVQFGMMLKSRSMDSVDGKQLSEDSEPETDIAMAKLHKFVTKMKRTYSESDLLSTVDSSQEESEFAKKFRQIRKTPSVDSYEPADQRATQLSLVPEDRESACMDDEEEAVFDTK